MTSETVIDVEEVDVLPAVRPIGQVSIYTSTNPDSQLAEARARAKVLVEVVHEQGLAKSFGGRKPHVEVEGWTFLASQFGLIPDIEWTRELDNGWEARAQLIRLSDGAVITHAESECRRDEVKGDKQRWKNANSFEIRSMAQTRATSKVCRNALSSVMVLAGFAATPAEEMDGIADKVVAPKSAEDPHCPACRVVHGTLVPVKQLKTKPYWRCTAKPEDCGAPREWKDKTYSWAGWHDSWETSAEEWLNDNGHGGPRTVEVGGRGNYWQWVLDEISTTLNVSPEVAKTLGKPGLIAAIEQGLFDCAEALGLPQEKVSEELTDEDLRAIAQNMTAGEAQLVVGAAVAEHTKSLEKPF
jgi:hypothetical protein